MAITRTDQIRAADWQPKLGELGEVLEGSQDVLQCIRTIVLTPKGSLPHQPEFGCGAWEYVDTPLQQARPSIIREVLDALERWEQRVEVVQVDAVADDVDVGTIVVTISVRMRATGGLSQTTVELSS